MAQGVVLAVMADQQFLAVAKELLTFHLTPDRLCVWARNLERAVTSRFIEHGIYYFIQLKQILIKLSQIVMFSQGYVTLMQMGMIINCIDICCPCK